MILSYMSYITKKIHAKGWSHVIWETRQSQNCYKMLPNITHLQLHLFSPKDWEYGKRQTSYKLDGLTLSHPINSVKVLKGLKGLTLMIEWFLYLSADSQFNRWWSSCIGLSTPVPLKPNVAYYTLPTTTTIYSPLSETTRVSRYQKKHLPTHTYHDHQPSFISFLHLVWFIASSLFNLHVWQSFCTTSLQVQFGLTWVWNSLLHIPKQVTLMIVILLLEIFIETYIDIQTIELYVLFYSWS